MTNVGFLNRIWLLFCKKEYNKFVKGLESIEREQENILISYLKTNAKTSYGKKYQFQTISSYSEFASRVPLIEDWNQIKDEIKFIANGQKLILTKEDVFALESTSGSTGFSKLIPYTKKLRQEFGKALNAWMYSLWLNRPDAFAGKSFWSISPTLKERSKTASGIPIGLESDIEYLDFFSAFLMKKVLVDTSRLNLQKNKNQFYLDCLSELLYNGELSFVSVWSPHYFLTLDGFLREHFNDLLNTEKIKKSERHIHLVKYKGQEFTWKMLWPNLSVLSCWDSAQSAVWITQLKQKVGDVFIQGKGLMSTEAACSFPYGKSHKSILAYRSHFFEFKDITSNIIYRAHELVINKQYELIVSTGSGLMRYCTKDIVEVSSHEKKVPFLKFKGRLGRISDLVGEKLHEMHLNQMLIEIWQTELINFKHVFVYPEKNHTSVCYIIAIESDKKLFDYEKKLEQSDKHLSQNPYYQQAIASGQLNPIKFKLMKNGTGKQVIKYLQSKNNTKLGDFKTPLLLIDEESIKLISIQNDH